ncbi:MAG TPA: queuosine biosynthesis protein [Microscillaceae bacterium]|nr:queuosine biosynthesis protein [Microscillaceae bacterium]
MQITNNSLIQFELPQHLACPLPTELRNMPRDAVRLLVTTGAGEASHDVFSNFDQYLQAGDVLVVNTSATVASAFAITLPNGKPGRLHLSTQLSDKEWLIEIRAIEGNTTTRWKAGQEGMKFKLPENVTVKLKERFYKNDQLLDLWVAEFDIRQEEEGYRHRYGQPIKYTQLENPFPLSYYQTFFSFHLGSAEMPSAGRGFTESLLRKLVRKGVVLAPITLHTGVSSLEEDEKPYPEYMEINPVTALLINTAKEEGRRVVAVGTTAIRAIESVANAQGQVKAFRGHTDLYIEDTHQMRVADGLLTGFHEPKASHLHMLQSLAGFEHIERAYQQAIEADYYWHQFGDLHLILA